eukprot:TRINITY_DN5017_c0_g1_i1.p3 TRINITY_DN5017_c0_g1~~TRINITY_DN5017_c0_g1_i1.p3  ORF type:complete len:105 (-),score=11.76 TRINITY_DN5017_c0_g1_i1:56-370(-)
MGQGDASLTKPNQTPNTEEYSLADRPWVLRSMVERETALTASQGPQVTTKWERMWEGQDNQEVGLEAAILERKRNSSLVQQPSCAEDVTGLKSSTEAADSCLMA